MCHDISKNRKKTWMEGKEGGGGTGEGMKEMLKKTV